MQDSHNFSVLSSKRSTRQLSNTSFRYGYLLSFAIIGVSILAVGFNADHRSISTTSEGLILQQRKDLRLEKLWNAAVDDSPTDAAVDSSKSALSLQAQPTEWNAASNDEALTFTLDTKPPVDEQQHIHFRNGEMHPVLPASVEANMITEGSADLLRAGGKYYLRLQDTERMPENSGHTSNQNPQAEAAFENTAPPSSVSSQVARTVAAPVGSQAGSQPSRTGMPVAGEASSPTAGASNSENLIAGLQVTADPAMHQANLRRRSDEYSC